jgi:hypothetical protein
LTGVACNSIVSIEYFLQTRRLRYILVFKN